MKRTTLVLALVLLGATSAAYGLYSVCPRGEWPASWPKELEGLRKQSRTLVGPEMENRHYAISFTKREEMEAAWPHLLAVKTKGAPIFLKRGESFFLGEKRKAGVVVHCPPLPVGKNTPAPEEPIAGVQEPHMRWMNTNYIELVVDGEIVDLNRLALPADTPIIDERFVEKKK